jgi:chromosome partitioning protein
MAIVVVGNTKGGVGKTTLAVQIALMRGVAGRSVLLIDADQQGSAQTAATMRAEAARTPPLTCVQLADGRLLRAQLDPLAAKHDDTIIDAGGRDTEALRVALRRSELLVVPVQPRAVDVWSLADVAELINQAQEARQEDGRPPLQVRAVLNLADPGDNRDTAETIEALGGFPHLSAAGPVIRRRKAIANAMANGLAVTELLPRDPKAVEEISQLVSNVFDVTEVAHGNHTAIKAE